MKQVLVQKGRATVDDVPAPQVEPGRVLVRVLHSCISIGTEMSGIRATGAPLWKRAMKQPAKVKQVAEMVARDGLAKTRDTVRRTVGATLPTGYSAAGIVVEVGEGIDDLRPGDRVACAGAQSAHHAEYISVPRNLTVAVPEGLDMAHASTVTLGAIALQGVRRANPTLGESFVVVGLGILGQITAQLLRANGCRVIGTDTDPARVRQALELGMDLGLQPEGGREVEQVARLTDGIGADGVIITAAAPGNEVLSTAFRMCRRKGRVVLVGDVGLDIDRGDIYAKELDFLVSTSYGPGRYDARYEEEGLDYPVSYVRWTENRNLGEYLRLMAEGRVRVGPLVEATYPVARAEEAYARLEQPGAKPLMVLLEYPQSAETGPPARVILNPQATPRKAGRIGMAVVGAGAFARAMHLPNLQALGDLFHLQAVVSRTGHNASTTAKEFGAAYAATDFAQVLEDGNVDAVIIATRHHLHAEMALQALAAGKHVLLEKPMALTRAELDRFRAFYAGGGDGKPVLLTGFNRRFSPFARRLAELTRGRSNPMMLDYRMNAGHIPLDHWVHGPEGGGRNIGEACHIYDLFTFLADSPATSVQARAIAPRTGYYSARDNFVATIGFEDGSVAALTYTALGSSQHPKERMELFTDGVVASLDDYLTLSIAGSRTPGITLRGADKGQKDELRAFGEAIRNGGPWPIPLWQQLQAMEIAFDVEAQISPSEARRGEEPA
jgi:predicted dehydrogenase/threonine dehydrogenase-like Zn-dependent dehydrogenase